MVYMNCCPHPPYSNDTVKMEEKSHWDGWPKKQHTMATHCYWIFFSDASLFTRINACSGILPPRLVFTSAQFFHVQLFKAWHTRTYTSPTPISINNVCILRQLVSLLWLILWLFQASLGVHCFFCGRLMSKRIDYGFLKLRSQGLPWLLWWSWKVNTGGFTGAAYWHHRLSTHLVFGKYYESIREFNHGR